MKSKDWLGFILISTFSLCAEAKTVHFAVAANFSKTMQSLVAEFEKKSDYEISLSFGSSGKFCFLDRRNDKPIKPNANIKIEDGALAFMGGAVSLSKVLPKSSSAGTSPIPPDCLDTSHSSGLPAAL
jgi:hypothetical protein